MESSNPIDGARRGDPAAWERLVREHQEAAFRLAYLLLGDAHDAEDAAQEAFIRAYQKLDRYDSARPFRPWLLTIVAHAARNRWRSVRRYAAALQRFATWDAESQPQPIPPDAATARQGEADALWQAVRRLGRADQEVIYLRYFLEVPVDEVAQALGVAPGTVKSRLHRALGRLRTVIESEFPALVEEHSP